VPLRQAPARRDHRRAGCPGARGVRRGPAVGYLLRPLRPLPRPLRGALAARRRGCCPAVPLAAQGLEGPHAARTATGQPTPVAASVSATLAVADPLPLSAADCLSCPPSARRQLAGKRVPGGSHRACPSHAAGPALVRGQAWALHSVDRRPLSRKTGLVARMSLREDPDLALRQAACVRRWSLRLGPVLAGGHRSYVRECTTVRGIQAVLKRHRKPARASTARRSCYARL
jgi:hypothetical protein